MACRAQGVVADWRIVMVYPILLLIDFLLSIPSVAKPIFDNVAQPANIRQALANVYRCGEEGVVLTPNEFRSLVVLNCHRGACFQRQAQLQAPSCMLPGACAQTMYAASLLQLVSIGVAVCSAA